MSPTPFVIVDPMTSPVPLTGLTDADLPPEFSALRRLADAGFRLAPLRIVPTAAEETFYRLNNLPAQLSALFRGVDLSDPDEDDLEELAPKAQRLVRAHFLLDEFVDGFYAGLSGLPAQLRVRRPNTGRVAHSGRVVARGRPALLALKDTWTDDWSFDALSARTVLEGSVALAAQPVLFAPPAQDDAGDAEAGRASSLLGERVRLLRDPALGLTGVRFL